jgi:hypothetical protein
MMLLEEVKSRLTKQVNMELTLEKLDTSFMNVITKYVEKTGTCDVGIQIKDNTTNELVKT